MFKIADGREYFYQYDLDRQVIVEDSSVVEVHFCNRTDECSLVVDVVDGLANVPNIILTNSFDIRVFGYDGKATRYDEVFKVKPRTKPADYVYVETEARKFDELMAKADEAITLANEITEYVENNKLDFVDDGEGNVELKAINPEGGEGGNVDLTGYATEEYVDEAIKNIEIPEVDLTGYAKKEDIPTVPTNVSAFTNDAGYLTEHIDISGKADKDHKHDEYLTEHQSLEGYATEKYVDDAIANIDISEGGGAKEVYYFDFNYTSWTKASDEAVEVFNRLISGEQLIVCIKGMYSYAVADICVQNARNIIFKTHFTDAIGTTTTVNEYLANYYNNSWDVMRENTSSNEYATQTYVTTAINEAFAGIATAEGGAY